MIPIGMMRLSEYPSFVVASTTTAGFTSFIAPSTRRNNAGSPLTILPIQIVDFEVCKSVCVITPPSSLLRQSFDLQHRTNLNRAVLRTRNAFSNAHRFVEISRVDQVVTAEVLASFREWTIRNQPFAVSHLHTRGCGHGMQRTSREVFA